MTMAWLFEDEKTAFTEKVLDKLQEDGALVPSIWHLEVVNVLLVAEKRKRCTPAQSLRFLETLNSFPIQVDDGLTGQKTEALLLLARSYELSSYDTAYLDLALRFGYPLATLDVQLRKACKSSKAQLLT